MTYEGKREILAILLVEMEDEILQNKNPSNAKLVRFDNAVKLEIQFDDEGIFNKEAFEKFFNISNEVDANNWAKMQPAYERLVNAAYKEQKALGNIEKFGSISY